MRTDPNQEHLLDHARCAALTRQHELDYTDQEPVYPESFFFF